MHDLKPVKARQPRHVAKLLASRYVVLHRKMLGRFDDKKLDRETLKKRTYE